MSTEHPAENESMRCASCGGELPTESAYCPKCGARTYAQPLRCDACGAELPPESASCNTCGARNVRRVRYSLWRVGILTFLSFGLYYLYWMYASWKHLVTEIPGKDFHPVWHALTQFVPIYNFVVIYQHFRTIREVQERERIESNLVPGLAVALALILPFILWIGVWILVAILLILSETISLGIVGIVILIPTIVGASAGTSIVLNLWGQRNLNRYWERPGTRHVRSARTGPGEIIISAVGGSFTAMVVIGIVAVIVLPGAIPIDVDSTLQGTIESHTQVDDYRFTVQGGASYTVYVSPTTLVDGDPLESAVVALWDLDGTTVLREVNDNTPIVIPWRTSSSGTMYVTVESNGFDLGSYQIRIAAR